MAGANDLRGVSHSGGTLAKQDDQALWQSMQRFVIEHFCRPNIPDWLLMGLTTQAIRLPLSKMKKFLAHTWRPRGWEWTNPDQQSKGAERKVRNGFASTQEICEERGEDADEILAEEAAYRAKRAKLGLPMPEELTAGGADEEVDIDEIVVAVVEKLADEPNPEKP